ncbi:hypothetical protein [Actinocorallia sp. A-T 12471]|uniref:hypothetical protein n=1 Tax=Actinocorallia sp. A-T 12471 TaxID=3089813 RepID=UPI0029CC8E3B|nr:hypothetical protein [Actinocorallia sp. A-T 12471]MDX6744959.1 hypothetical protein [Actinocorallia sp. A-T 12471]
MSEPMSAFETERFINEMIPLVAHHLTEGGRFRISAYTPELQAAFQEVTSRTSAALGRPLMGYTNGREFWIVPSDTETAQTPLTP